MFSPSRHRERETKFQLYIKQKTNDTDKEFLTSLDFENLHLTQEQFERIETIISDNREACTTTKVRVGKQKQNCIYSWKNRNIQKTKKKQNNITFKRKNKKSIRHYTKKWHKVSSNQRTTKKRQYNYKPSDNSQKRGSYKNSSRRKIFEQYDWPSKMQLTNQTSRCSTYKN